MPNTVHMKDKAITQRKNNAKVHPEAAYNALVKILPIQLQAGIFHRKFTF